MTKTFKPILWKVTGGAVLTMAVVFLATPRTNSTHKRISRALQAPLRPIRPHLERSDIVEALGRRRLHSTDIKASSLPIVVKGKNYSAKLTIDKGLQERVEEAYDFYNPDYAAFVAVDPSTGRVLAMVDRSADKRENLAISAGFPAASVFKVVTSAAALDEKKIEPHTMIPINGSYGTLYKRNLREQITRWTRFISIEEAFAKSVNTAFAKIAMNRVGPQALQRYADAFGFNQLIPFDMPIEPSSARIPADDSFGLAESGSGYTRRQTLSPVQGALIAATVINGGEMPMPYLVETVDTENGTEVYEAPKTKFYKTVDKNTAQALSMIMEHTITQGTAKKEYRDYNRHPVLSKIFVGAKTGSLSGDNPAGRYDWFVGFAQSSTNPSKKIAFASLIINRKYWRVKSAHIAREAIIEYFSRNAIAL